MDAPDRRSTVNRLLSELRPALPVLMAVAGLACALYLLDRLDGFTPVRNWFFWKLAMFWFWQLVFVSGCLSLGTLVCQFALRDTRLPVFERLVFELASGAVAFALLIYLAGALRVLHPVFAVAMPLGAIAAAFIRVRPRMITTLRGLRDIRWAMSPLRLAVTGFGVIGLALIYLHILFPWSVNHDAHWTHLVIAQNYAREGRIVPFFAGWPRNFPHLASVIFTWCFLVPGLSEPEQLVLVMHTEFIFLVGTLLAVTAAANWLVQEEEGAPGYWMAWVVFFLFPSIFIYDGNLGGSADHVAAFFVLPMFLAFMRGSEHFSSGMCLLAGGLAGAALITKYQSAYSILGAGLVVTVRLGRVALRRYRQSGGPGPSLRAALQGTGWLAGGFALTSGPYFIENLIFYRNPVFPFMQDVFTGSTPTIPEAAWLMANVTTPAALRAVPELGPRVWNGLNALLTFAFTPRYAFTNGVPYFGFLFTLLAPVALVLPRGNRLRVGALVGAIAVLCWGMTYLVDRNLQISLPILVAVTAALIIRIWQLGWIARVGLVPVLAIQVVWGADYMLDGPVENSVAEIRNGVAGLVNVRETFERRAMTRALPEDATVLLHAEHVSLGLNRTVLDDLGETQGLIDYHALRTPREAYDRFREIGVTHLTWMEPSLTVNPLKQADIIFMAFAKQLPATRFGQYKLAKMPAQPPAVRPPFRVLVSGVPGYFDGLYPIDELSKCEMRPPTACTPSKFIAPGPLTPEVLNTVDAVLLAPGGRLEPAADGVFRARFQMAMSNSQYEIHLRR